MTLFRGYGGDLPLMRWLRGEDLAGRGASSRPRTSTGATRLACVEMIRTGTARFWDMYWHPEATARAVGDAGLRATIGAPLIDADGEPGELRERRPRSLEHLDRLRPAGRARARPARDLHGQRGVAALDRRARRPSAACRSRSTSPRPSRRCERLPRPSTACAPPHYLDRLGLLGERTLLAHGVWLDPAELELIAERGATVVTNPVANMKLAVGGVFPYPRPAAGASRSASAPTAPAPTTRSTCSPTSRPSRSIQKHAAADPAALDGRRGLGGRHRRPRPAARRSAAGGRRRRPTSCCCAATPPSWGSATLDADLVYAASGAVVDTTVVAGRVLMRGGEVPEAAEVVARARERAQRLGTV